MADARIDVSIEHKQLAEPPTKRSSEHVPELRVALPRTTSSPRRSASAPSAVTTSRCQAHERIARLADEGAFVEEAAGLRPPTRSGSSTSARTTERLTEAEVTTGLSEAMVVGSGEIERPSARARSDGLRVHGRLDGERRHGEKYARACETLRPSAGHRSIPSPSSGGARMQEGILALMPLPKTVVRGRGAARRGLRAVSGSPTRPPARAAGELCELGDVMIAEPRRADRRSPARESSSRRRGRSCPTTSGSRSRTSASAISTPSSATRAAPRTWRGCSVSSARREAEIRLRDRLEQAVEVCRCSAEPGSRVKRSGSSVC